jgi:uncharacterized protein YdiU (UPF0061 family)
MTTIGQNYATVQALDGAKQIDSQKKEGQCRTYLDLLRRLAIDQQHENDDALLHELMDAFDLRERDVTEDIDAVRRLDRYERELQATSDILDKHPALERLQETYDKIEAEVAQKVRELLQPKRELERLMEEVTSHVEVKRSIESSMRSLRNRLNRRGN